MYTCYWYIDVNDCSSTELNMYISNFCPRSLSLSLSLPPFACIFYRQIRCCLFYLIFYYSLQTEEKCLMVSYYQFPWDRNIMSFEHTFFLCVIFVGRLFVYILFFVKMQHEYIKITILTLSQPILEAYDDIGIQIMGYKSNSWHMCVLLFLFICFFLTSFSIQMRTLFGLNRFGFHCLTLCVFFALLLEMQPMKSKLQTEKYWLVLVMIFGFDKKQFKFKIGQLYNNSIC